LFAETLVAFKGCKISQPAETNGSRVSSQFDSYCTRRLGIAQSRVSDLVRGKWEKFSLETPITLEARIGRTVRVELAA